MDRHKEVHERLPKESIDVLKYRPLISKVFHSFANEHGQYIYDLEEELFQEGYVALKKALESYDPTRGTFVTLAWLRIRTYMKRLISKEAEVYANVSHLEDLTLPNDSSESLVWEDLFPSNQVDFAAVARLSCHDSLDWKILRAITEEGINRRQVHIHLGLPFHITQRRIERLKTNMAAVTTELYDPTKSL